MNLYAEFKQAEEENFNLERKAKQLESKYNQARAQMATEIEEKENLQRQLTEMENTLNLMKEIVFENSDNVNKVGFHSNLPIGCFWLADQWKVRIVIKTN